MILPRLFTRLSTGLFKALRAVIIVVAVIVIVGLVWNYFTNSGQPSGGEFALFLVAIIALLGALGGNKT